MNARKRSALAHALLACAVLLGLQLAPANVQGAPDPPADAALGSPLLPPIAEDSTGEYLLSEDGTTVVYRPSDNAFGGPSYGVPIYSVPVDGSAPPAVLVEAAGQALSLVGISMGSLVYVAYGASSGTWSIQSVPLDGSGPRIVAAGAAPYSPSLYIQFGAGARVVFQVYRPAEGGTVVQLLSAPLDGSAPPSVLLTSSRPDEWLTWWVAGAARDRVLAVVNSAGARSAVLWSFPIAGPAEARVRLGDMDTGGVVRLSQDGRTAAFTLQRRLYAVPANGSAPARAISPPPGEAQWIRSPELTPDGSAAVFLLEEPDPADPISGRAYAYSAPSDGSTPAVRLDSRPIRVEPYFGAFITFAMSPDSRKVAYADATAVGLRVASIGVPESATLLEGVTATYGYRFLDNERLLVSFPEPLLRPLNPALPPIRLIPAPVESRSEVQVSGDRALFLGCLSPCQRRDGWTLFSAPLAASGGRAVRLATWHRNDGFGRFTAVGDRVVYAADSDTRPGAEIYSVPIAPLGVGFASGALMLTEGDPGRLELRLERPAPEPVSVSYRIEGLGLPRRGALSFAPGVVSQTIDLQLAADGRFTGDRLVRVSLQETVGAAPALWDQVAVLIRDAEARRLWLPKIARNYR